MTPRRTSNRPYLLVREGRVIDRGVVQLDPEARCCGQRIGAFALPEFLQGSFPTRSALPFPIASHIAPDVSSDDHEDRFLRG